MLCPGETRWEILNDIWYQKITMSLTGKVFYEYHYKGKAGKLCFVVEMNTSLTSKICGYTLIEKDLRETLSFIQEHKKIYGQSTEKVDNKEKEVLLRSLVRAAVVTYGKCFTKAKGREKLKLIKEIISGEHLESHEELMELRHEFAAHAGEAGYESCKSVMVLPPEGKYKKGQQVFPGHFTELRQTITSSGFIVPEKYIKLIEWLRSYVIEQQQELLKQESHHLNLISPLEFYKLPGNKHGRIVVTEKDLEKMVQRSR